jgi:tungstate transport system ATP-binding protein
VKNVEFLAENISKTFEDKYALKNVNLIGEKGKILAIIGPSGAGKTTLLRIINMLDLPTKGTMKIEGKDINDLANGGRYEIRMRMGMVFQNPILFQRTVEANVAYALKIRNHSPDKIDLEVQKALSLVGCGNLKEQFAPTLSAGEAQRVAFARAIVFEPELLLLDEFTANLDPANVQLLENAVHKYHIDTNATIVLSTHNLFQAKRLAHKIAFFLNGEIVEIQETEKFFEDPQHPTTKAFLSGELVC